MNSNASEWIVLYDGVCGLCNRLNMFVLRHDRRNRFRFATLQSGLAGMIVQLHGKDPRDLDTLYLGENPGEPNEQLYARSQAVLKILSVLGGICRILIVLRVLPDFVLDGAYNWIARNRYRIFGKYDSCPVPDARSKSK